MPTITTEQQALIAMIRGLLGNRTFDTTMISEMTFDHPELVSAIEAAITRRNCRWWGKRGQVRGQAHGALFYLFRRLAKDQYLVTTEQLARP